MNYHYNIVSEEMPYRGFFQIIRYQIEIDYYDGSRSDVLVRECLGKKGRVVAALPYDPITEEFVFVEQFRIGAMAAGDHPWQQEIVAGFMDKINESPVEAIQRELVEEIGTMAISLEQVYEYYGSAGGSGGRIVIFFAQIEADKTSRYTGVRAEGEDIRVLRVPYAKAFQALKSAQIENATMIVALQAFLLKYPEIQKKYAG